MTIRECATMICHENGMDEQEIEAFLKFLDQNSDNGGVEKCKEHTVEALSERGQAAFMQMIRWILPMHVQRFRDQTAQQTITE